MPEIQTAGPARFMPPLWIEKATAFPEDPTIVPEEPTVVPEEHDVHPVVHGRPRPMPHASSEAL